MRSRVCVCVFLRVSAPLVLLREHLPSQVAFSLKQARDQVPAIISLQKLKLLTFRRITWKMLSSLLESSPFSRSKVLTLSEEEEKAGLNERAKDAPRT